MALIVAARYTTFEQAQGAATALFAQGFAEDDVHIFYVNTAGAHAKYPIGGDRKADPDASGAQYGALLGGAGLALVGAVVGGLIGGALQLAPLALLAVAGVGAYIGSLMGALWVTGRRQPRSGSSPSGHPEHPEVRSAGVLLALHTDPSREAQACKILRDAGGMDVERAQGRWQEGRWVDFDPLQPPDREPASVGASAPGTSDGNRFSPR
jgi:predicted lipid-binding transport protein (Tim44 family)